MPSNTVVIILLAGYVAIIAIVLLKAWSRRHTTDYEGKHRRTQEEQ